jgi:hypothetical protein
MTKLAPLRLVQTLIAVIAIAALVSARSPSPSDRGQANISSDAVHLLRHYAAVGLDKLEPADTRDMARLLAERSIVADVMAPLPYTGQAIDSMAGVLSEAQSRWLEGKTAGVTTSILADRITQQLELNNAPETLAIRVAHVNRARVRVWSHVPELRVAPIETSASAAATRQLFPERLSPFEALMVVEMVLHRKMTDPAFSKTESEERSTPFPPLVSRKPGIYVVELDPRQEAFREHVRSVASVKWPTAEKALSLIPTILEADHAR